MLDLFNLKEKNQVSKYTKNNYKKTSKHFPSPLREWKNSIYVFNKNSLNSILSTTIVANNIIKNYFSLYNNKLEAKMRTKRLNLKLRRLSSNKYYISNGGFKHTNNKVLVNLYVFNREKANYLLTLKKWYLETFLTKSAMIKTNINMRLIKRLRLINEKGIEAIKTLSKDKYLLIKALDMISKNNIFNINTFKDLSKYTESFYKKIIKKSLKKIKMYFYYKQLLYINKSKLNYTYLHYLKKHLEKIYNKNVEFNVINIDRFYLNSDILSESLALKISRNRSKVLRFMNKLRNKVAVVKKSIFNSTSYKKLNSGTNLSHDELSLGKFVLNNLKYKDVTGFRLQAKGRLNRRFTASRSSKKLKYKGTISDIDSSHKGLSSILLKGNLKSNMQYTKLKSKTRVGSFGIKGWVAGN